MDYQPRQRTRHSHGRSMSPYTNPHKHGDPLVSAAPMINTGGRRGSSSGSSAWQQLVVGASTAAGTTAAVISEQSLKAMQYCLSWVQYAIRHIEQQMHVIRSFLVSLASQSSSQHLSVRADPSVLSAVRKDLVQTLKKVVDVISRYASTSLPYHAKMTVRGFILSLPGRWAVLNDLQSTTTSPAASPMMSTMRDPVVVDDRAPKHEESAMRLLNFGQESVDMLQSVSTVFSDTVDRAHLWIERLRLHPPAQHHDEHIQLPPIHTLDTPLASSLPSSPYTSSPSAYSTAATSTAYASSFHSPSTSSPAVSMH